MPAIQSFDQLQALLANTSPKTLAVAAAHETHTLEAVFHAKQTLPVPLHVLLVGNKAKILSITQEIGWQVDPATIVESVDETDCAQKAVALVREGKANALMKGLLETKVLLKAVLDKDNGIRGTGVMSHVAVVESPAYHKLVYVTDGGITPHPTLEQKAAIIENTVTFLHGLGIEQPKIAALAATESVSDKMPETVEAAQLAVMAQNGAFGNCLVEGPVSVDIAVSKESAAVKGYKGQIAGEADVFLAPCIHTGNIMVKILLFWGGAKMAGCLLGAKVPIVLLSRGATAEEKRLSIMLCLGLQS